MIGKIAIAVIALPAAAATTILVPLAYAKWSARSLASRCRRARALVLTYDDGPGGIFTPRLLEVLRRRHAKATFFAVGKQAANHPEVLDQIAAEGHEIGCHGYWHRHAWKTPHKAVTCIHEGFAGLSRWIAPNGLFRPPHGKITLFTWVSLLRRSSPIVWWTHDSGDTHTGDLPQVDAIVDGVVNAGGGVVLMHDFDRCAKDEVHPRHEYVLNLTDRLIERARQADLRIMTVGELLEAQRP
jgi:peptidoglycan-N-acetylglucosamine deacetylase